jgi:hypothetical protein
LPATRSHGRLAYHLAPTLSALFSEVGAGQNVAQALDEERFLTVAAGFRPDFALRLLAP